MKIRSVTCFFDPLNRNPNNAPQTLGHLAADVRAQLELAGYEVQTTRLATLPFGEWLPINHPHNALRQVQALEQQAKALGFDYLSIGPALPTDPNSYDLVVPILSETQDVFLSGGMTSYNPATPPALEVFPQAVKACAAIIHNLAPLEPNGFANLRFAALANVAPHGPFFPGAFHRTIAHGHSERPALSIALECADVALDAALQADSLPDFRRRLLYALETHADALAARVHHVLQQFDVDFRGFDFSLAPFPADWCSLGGTLEALGLPMLGAAGSLAAAAFLASTLDLGNWQRAGFNGLMMPVLEDSILAARSAQGTFRVQDILLYSAVCGTGLDTVPLPGDTSTEELYAILLDVAALAVRLNKPLTARLMPIPNRLAGDPTTFDFAFFANGGVLPSGAHPLHGLLTSDAPYTLPPRQR